MSALGGLVIADFGRVLAAPYATMLLADLGAEVVKIEPPGGDETRRWGPPFVDGQATYFLSVNRNKSSVVVDLASEEGLAAAREVVDRADVVVENFRPGVMERFGLGYSALRAERPGLVYCSVTGFGAGKGRDLPGYDLLVQAVGGLMSVTGERGGEPVKAGVALVDVLTGVHAAVGILAALRHRDATGEGQLVEVDLLSVLLSSMVNQSAGYTAGGVVPGMLGNRHPSIAPYEVVRAADGPMVLAVGNDRQFRRLCSVLGVGDDPRFASNSSRVAHVDELMGLLGPLLLEKTAREWFAVLTPLGVPCGPVNDLAGAFDLAADLGLDPVVDVDGVDLVANPIRLSRTPATYRLPPPRLA